MRVDLKGRACGEERRKEEVALFSVCFHLSSSLPRFLLSGARTTAGRQCVGLRCHTPAVASVPCRGAQCREPGHAVVCGG